MGGDFKEAKRLTPLEYFLPAGGDLPNAVVVGRSHDEIR